MADRISQETVEAEIVATPQARVTIETVEASVIAQPHARISQETLEALAIATPGARISQETLEAEVIGTPHAKLSGLWVEWLVPNIGVFMPIVYPTLPGLGYSVFWNSEFFNMKTQKMAGGAELDLTIADAPLHDFVLTYTALRNPQAYIGFYEEKILRGFFFAVRANAGRFLFKNPDDFQVQQQFIATTDGSTHLVDAKPYLRLPENMVGTGARQDNVDSPHNRSMRILAG